MIFWGRVFLIVIFSILILSCESSIEKITTLENENKELLQNNEGPIADGHPNTIYPDWQTSPNILHCPVGKAYKIDLGNCSGSYHSKGKPDEFAIDFNMGIGTLIIALRSGKVVHVEESGFDGQHPNNLVIIDHGDHTFAEYMHLTRNVALVNVGDIVEKGKSIGLSENTGLSGYPHLHFVVTSESWQWSYVSIPVTFSNTISNEKSLASSTIYEACNYWIIISKINI
ncbi:MAG: M23 family metallopeptidase [Ignavibacteriae bacterium]|nr:M23 family metallopeptidase [Ignavibacteriota bacterium]